LVTLSQTELVAFGYRELLLSSCHCHLNEFWILTAQADEKRKAKGAADEATTTDPSSSSMAGWLCAPETREHMLRRTMPRFPPRVTSTHGTYAPGIF